MASSKLKKTYPPGTWFPRKLRSQNYTIPFVDHTDRPALMTFQSNELSPLPPLKSFIFYFTHPETTIGDIEPNVQEFLSAMSGASAGADFRLDVHFLPDPSNDDCISHYEGELAARGTISVQLSVVDAPDEELSHSPGSLPGLIPRYRCDPGMDFYHKCLFIVSTRDWQGEDQRVRRLRFDVISNEEYERYQKENQCEEDEEWNPLQATEVLELSLRHKDLRTPSELTNRLLRMWDVIHSLRLLGEDEYLSDEAWEHGKNQKWQVWPVRNFPDM